MEAPENYHVLCVGYALQLLGSRFEHPIRTCFVLGELDDLPWAKNAWTAGTAVDALGTAMARNLIDHGECGPLPALIGWLTLGADRRREPGGKRMRKTAGCRSSMGSTG